MAQRITLVTGSRSGIGRAVAGLLESRGGKVIGLDVADADIVADLSTPEGRAQAVEAAGRLRPDGLDAVIACAGVAIPDGPRTISVNYFGVVEVMEGLRPLLLKGNAPRAVVVASSANILPSDPALVTACLDGREDVARDRARDNPLAYASSKLAITRWIRRASVAPGWADRGLLLNGIAPGLVLTPMTAAMVETEEGRATLRQSAPHATPKPAEAEDIAPLLAFLGSPDNRHMVGQVPFCDGGCDVLLRGDDVVAPAPL